VSTASVTGAAPESVYQSERYGDFTYVFASLSPGTTYTVRLHFAEIYFTSAGQRVFNVLLNDQTALSRYDIYADVGAFQATVKTFAVVADSYGKIRMYFESLVNNAQANGIEVIAPTSSADAGADGAKSDAATSDAAKSDGSAAHSVLLDWTASTTPGVTYDLLRGTVSGGPYTQILSGISTTTTTDTTVAAGATYYYVARSQDSSGQSVNSNEVKAVIP
jgi:hypothetical protein